MFAADTGDEEIDNKVKEIRNENMVKILKTVDIKNNIRDKEIKEVD